MSRRRNRYSPAQRSALHVVAVCGVIGAITGWALAGDVDTAWHLHGLMIGMLIGASLVWAGRKAFKGSGHGPASKARGKFHNGSPPSPQAHKIQDQKAGVLTGEDFLQRQILDWLATTRPDIFVAHIPNGGHTSWRAAHLMRVGMVKGMPDLILIGARGQVGFLEVKTASGSLRREQRSIQALLTTRGLPHAVVRSPAECNQALYSWGW